MVPRLNEILSQTPGVVTDTPQRSSRRRCEPISKILCDTLRGELGAPESLSLLSGLSQKLVRGGRKYVERRAIGSNASIDVNVVRRVGRHDVVPDGNVEIGSGVPLDDT